MIGAVLLTGGLAAPLVGVLGPAIGRSVRRQECARLRDQLVDAARCGALDVTDWRVFSLIDWFDQVATTGRTGTPGRHACDRPDPSTSLARSLATTLLPLGPDRRCLVDPAWPDPAIGDAGPAVQAAALAYRERHLGRLRYRPALSWAALSWSALSRSAPSRPARSGSALSWPARPRPALSWPALSWPALSRPAVPRPRVAVTGPAKPPGALMPVTGPLDLRDGAGDVVLPSLVEEIFAVAGGRR